MFLLAGRERFGICVHLGGCFFEAKRGFCRVVVGSVCSPEGACGSTTAERRENWHSNDVARVAADAMEAPSGGTL